MLLQKTKSTRNSETYGCFIKRVISQNIAEITLSLTSTLNNLKSSIKQVYQKGWTHKYKKKKDLDIYFRAG